MKLSQLFSKTIKQIPADETAKNAQLLIKAGYIHKEMAGVYSFLPLGFKVVENIKQIVREEMNALGAQELIMTSLQPKALWQGTDRWDDKNVDVWFKSRLKNGSEVGFGWSHEEPITAMLKDYTSSYRDLPISVYQFQTKLRNETRAKSGIMRCREFVMKDLYTYAKSEKELQTIYDKVADAYKEIYRNVGLGDDTFFTFASGGAFTQFSHEFQTVSDAGEDIIYLDRVKKIAINKEVYTDAVIAQLGLNKSKLVEVKASEVGNIFNFGTSKSEQMGLSYNDESGKQVPVFLGSYGIGITRLMGVIVEHYADERGIVWPESVAPARVHIVSIGENKHVRQEAEMQYEKLKNLGIDAIYDDRGESAGTKLADADLMGMPTRLVVSDKTLETHSVEIKKRNEKNTVLVPLDKVASLFVNTSKT
jgi:prolyl-tRNA synthetase